MNDHSAPPCPYTDDVLAAFLDGAAVADDHRLAEHRDACPYCRRALDRTRALDALLAAQTRTDADDALADRVLAFDAAVAPRAVGRRVAPALAVAAAVVILAGAWAFLRGQALTTPAGTMPERDPDPIVAAEGPVRSTQESPRYRAPRTIASPTSLRVLGDLRLPAALAPGRDADAWITAGAGGPADADAYREVAQRAEFLASVEAVDASDDLRVAAARWLAREAQGGRLAARRLWGVAEWLAESDGALRTALVGQFRDERALRRLLDHRLPGRHATWRARDRLVAVLIGATGARRRLDRVRSAPTDVIAATIAAARATADRRASDFAVALACDVVLRGAVARGTVTEWLAATGPDDAWLTRALDERVHRDRREPTRDLCRAVLAVRQAARPGVL